jgi:hypothetical protein
MLVRECTNMLIDHICKTLPQEQIDTLSDMNNDQLALTHYSLGAWLRNEFLHGAECRDILEELAIELKVDAEADAVSAALVEALWAELQVD